MTAFGKEIDNDIDNDIVGYFGFQKTEWVSKKPNGLRRRRMIKQAKWKIDEAKAYLKQYDVLKSEKANLIGERRQILYEVALPGSVDYSADRVQTSPSDQMLAKILKIESRSAEIDARLGQIEQQMNTIKYEVNCIPDSVAKRLLHMRYIETYRWNAITEELNDRYHLDYNENYVRGKLHSGCLKIFLKEVYKR